jgi:hypothetical protein
LRPTLAATRWLIDDIRGAIDSEWSVRQILGNYRG